MKEFLMGKDRNKVELVGQFRQRNSMSKGTEG